MFGVGRKLTKTPPGEFFGEMREKHGKVFRVKAFVGYYLVVVADVDGAETVIRNEGKYPSRGDVLKTMNLIITEHKRSKGVPNAGSSLELTSV